MISAAHKVRSRLNLLVGFAFLVSMSACSSSTTTTGGSAGETGLSTGGKSGGAGGASSAVELGGTRSTSTTNATGGSEVANSTKATGGSSATGGMSAVGGSKTTTSAKATGGSSAIGGASASGGTSGNNTKTSSTTSATGGAQPTGGAQSAGGSGTKATGAGGSAPTGGSQAAGGSSTAGGASSTASGGSSTTGGASAGGGSSSTKSAGCGIASPLKTGTFSETVDGTARKWMLDVPSNYDGTKPYRLIFVWHPLGGNGSQIVSGGYNGLKSLSNGEAIFATADGLNGSNSEASGTGWWNKNNGDMKLVQTMLDKINAGLCVDQERIFTTGFSFGGMMSYTLPFVFDIFRATAPCSGKEGVIDYTAKYSRTIPIMAFHGNNDTFVKTALGKAFFDKYRTTRNHCGDQTKPVDPSPCVQYQGCDSPTTWCEFSGAHETWSQEPQAIWKFFSQF